MARRNKLKPQGVSLLDRPWTALAVAIASLAYLSAWAWGRCGDLIIDSGREMQVPHELLAGKLLYRDVFYLYGPFSPYLNAALYRLFGTSLNVLSAGGLAAAAAAGWFVYLLSRRFLSGLHSLLAMLTFFFVLAFGQYVYLANYNFLLPYSYASAHSALFCLAALYFFSSALTDAAAAYLCGLCAALALLTRIDMGLMLSATLIGGLAAAVASGQSAPRDALRTSVKTLLLPFSAVAIVYGFFILETGSVFSKSSLLDLWSSNLNPAHKFTGWLSGTDDLARNLALGGKSLGFYAALALTFWTAGKAVDFLMKRGLATVAIALGLASLWLALIFKGHWFNYDLQFRCLPLLALAACVVSCSRASRGSDQAKNLALFSLSLFSFLALGRMFFHVWAGHYGFYLLAPAIIVYYVFFLDLLAGLCGGARQKMLFQVGFTVISLGFIYEHYGVTAYCRRNQTLTVSSQRGALQLFDTPANERCKELIEYLRRKAGPGDTLAVFPEGLAINYFSGLENPLYYYEYLPQDISRAEVEQDLIHDVAAKRVEYVAVVQRKADEYGAPDFGKDYATSLAGYIDKAYSLCAQFGPMPFSGPEFGVALYKRKPLGSGLELSGSSCRGRRDKGQGHPGLGASATRGPAGPGPSPA
jgi:hypothetical protein